MEFHLFALKTSEKQMSTVHEHTHTHRSKVLFLHSERSTKTEGNMEGDGGVFLLLSEVSGRAAQ